MEIVYLISGVLFLLFIIAIVQYNQLNKSRNQIENAISSLDAVFIKRSDLIPNLITTVKEHMAFETDTLAKITAMRQENAKTNPAEVEKGSLALKNLMLQVENYPDLKSNRQFIHLQQSWNEIEEQISAGRRFVSASITAYNDKVNTIPGNLMAKAVGHKNYEWQYATPEQQKNISAAELF